MTTRRDLIARVDALETRVGELEAAVKAAKAAATRATRAAKEASSSDGHGE